MEKYTEAFLDRLRNSVDITEIIRNRSKRGAVKREGAWYVSHCLNPSHEDSSPSMKWKEKDTMVNCFACSWKADVFGIIQALEGCDFPTAVRQVKELVEGGDESLSSTRDDVKRSFKEQDSGPKKVMDLSAWERSSDRLFNFPVIVEYLASRGLTEETMRRFRLAPMADGKNIIAGEMRDLPWVGIPYIREGKVASVKYRAASHEVKGYTSAKGMGGGMFNAEPETGEFEDLYLTFGEFDAMVLEQAGFRAMSCQSDSRLPDLEERKMLLKAGRLIYAGDNDKSCMTVMNTLGMQLKAGKILTWPEGFKDANAYFLQCETVEFFRAEVERLTAEAKDPTPPGFTTLSEQVVAVGRGGAIEDDPLRFRMPWPSVDRMFYLLPGHVIVVSANLTGTGKSTFINQCMLWNAMLGEPGDPVRKVPAIYAAEQSPDELARMSIACIATVDKTRITPEDVAFTLQMLNGVRFYIGYDPTRTKAKEVLDLCEGASRHLGITDLVIDNMGFVGRNEMPGQLYQAQADAMQRIKNLAKEIALRIWVLVGAGKAQPGERGKWSANAEAGTAAFEADADHMINLHRNYLSGRDLNENSQDSMDPITTVFRKKSRWPGPGPAISRLYLEGSQAKFREVMPGEEPR